MIPGAQIVSTDEFWTGEGFDLDRLSREVVAPLSVGTVARFASYDWSARRTRGLRVVEPVGIVVVEGVCALHRIAARRVCGEDLGRGSVRRAARARRGPGRRGGACHLGRRLDAVRGRATSSATIRSAARISSSTAGRGWARATRSGVVRPAPLAAAPPGGRPRRGRVRWDGRPPPRRASAPESTRR